MWRADSLEKSLILGKIEGRRRRGWQRMRWLDGIFHRLSGHEFGWTPGAGDGQGGLAFCYSWGCKESDTTERLNWTELHWTASGIHCDEYKIRILILFFQIKLFLMRNRTIIFSLFYKLPLHSSHELMQIHTHSHMYTSTSPSELSWRLSIYCLICRFFKKEIFKYLMEKPCHSWSLVKFFLDIFFCLCFQIKFKLLFQV